MFKNFLKKTVDVSGHLVVIFTHAAVSVTKQKANNLIIIQSLRISRAFFVGGIK